MATANVLTYAELFQTTLDEQMLQELTSAWMEPNASLVRYSGGKEIKIPKISVDGLGDYSRTDGFSGLSGAATLEWETRSLSMDRAKEFNIDSMDVDETAFVPTAGVIMGEFQRTKVVPEVDAYRYSRIFTLANAQLRTEAYTPAAGTVFSQLKGNIRDIQDVIGEAEPLVVCISYASADLLDRSTEFDRTVPLVDFTMGGITTKVRMIDGVPLIRVPSARFKSAYTFSSTNGFSAAATAMVINWMIIPRSAAIGVVKTEKIRMFGPEANQAADGWKIQYRKYHDIFLLDNKFVGVWVSYTSIAAPALTATVAAGTAAGTKFTATAATGNSLAYLKSATGTSVVTPVYNQVVTGLTAYTSGADIASAIATDILQMYELDAAGHVVKYATKVLVSGDIHA